jgi:hypothetical protein
MTRLLRDMQGAVLLDKDGNVINRMSGDDFGHRVGGDVEIVRGTLCQILRDHLWDIELIFGDTIQKIAQSATAHRSSSQRMTCASSIA